MATTDFAQVWSFGHGSTPELVVRAYTEDAVRVDCNTGLRSEGRTGILAFATLFQGAIPDAVCEVVNLIEAPGVEVVEWTYSGTHTGDVDGWPATGKRFTLHGCNVCHLENSLILEEHSYWDWESLRRA
jgi:steroid delta-isomerase-like uncharacterized protein